MQRINIFLILFVVSLVSLVVLFILGAYIFPSTSQNDWFSDMWGHMGGMMGGTGSGNPYGIYLGVVVVVLIILVIASVAGLVYFIFLPEIKTKPVLVQKQNYSNNSGSLALESVLKTLTEDERKVLEVLREHDGKYLQKYIRKEAGLSRLKTHRILARFAERGIVTLEKTGNTNEVQIVDWLN